MTRRSDRPSQRWRYASVHISLAAALAGCAFGTQRDPVPPAGPALPCDNPAGSEWFRSWAGDPPARFNTSGARLYVEVAGFEHSQPFDPDVGSSIIWIGDDKDQPAYDPARSTVTGSKTELRAKEFTPAPLDLPAGSYWIWASNAPRLRLLSCDSDATLTLTSASPTPSTTS